MFRRTRSTFALVAALLALAIQCCVPLAHAVHERAVASVHPHAAAEAHHHHDAGEQSEHRHDESRCPTCQHFLALRAFTPTVAPLTLVVVHESSLESAPSYAEPFVPQVAHAPAVPRGPPVD
jgi:hypothetical protein